MPIVLRNLLRSFLLSPPTQVPSKRTSPVLTSVIRLTQRNSVDLPAPDGPITATNSPFLTEKLTSSSAGFAARS